MRDCVVITRVHVYSREPFYPGVCVHVQYTVCTYVRNINSISGTATEHCSSLVCILVCVCVCVCVWVGDKHVCACDVVPIPLTFHKKK